MQTIEKFIIDTIPPRQTNVVWIDSSGNTPIFKTFVNGEWRTIELNILTPELMGEILSYVKKNAAVGDFSNDVGYLTDTTLPNSQNFKSKSDKTLIYTSLPSGGMKPNTVYNLGTITTDTTFTQDITNIDTTIANEWWFTFNTVGASNAPTITMPAYNATTNPYGIARWYGDAPEFDVDKYYEISIMDNVGICLEIEPEE